MKTATILIVISICSGILFEFLGYTSLYPSTSKEYAQQAYALMHKKRYNQALVYLKKAIELNPDDNEALGRCIGLYCLQKKDPQKVIDLCSSVIEKSPENIEAYGWRINAFFENDEASNAIKDMKTIAKIKPNDARTHIIRALGFNWINDDKESVKCVSKAIEIDPQNAEYYVERGDYYINCSNYQEAENDFSKAISMNPNCVKAYQARCRLYNHLGKKELLSKAKEKWLSMNGPPGL